MELVSFRGEGLQGSVLDGVNGKAGTGEFRRGLGWGKMSEWTL